MSINPLHQLHERVEATFLPYGDDVHIVESYGEIETEYAAIRKGVGLMDSPHRGVVILTGKDRLSFLHNKLTNDTKSLQPGQGCYAYLLNLKGRIVMDLNILHAEEATLVEMDQRLAASFVDMMDKYIFTEDVRVLNGSEQLGRFTLIGPQSRALLRRAINIAPGLPGIAPHHHNEPPTDLNPPHPKTPNAIALAGGGGELDALNAPFRHVKLQLGNAAVTVFRNDLCGEEQYELIVPRDQVVTLWELLHDAGAPDDGHAGAGLHLRGIGWSAFNTARIEAGTPLYGIDITDNYLPMETGHWYLRAVAVSKGCYLGQEIVARMHAHQAVARLFVGLRVEGDKLPVAGTDILDDKGAEEGGGGMQVGMITSSCLSPMLGNIPIAMGYVKKAFAPAGRQVRVLAEGSRANATVVDLPFWKKPG